MLSLSQEQNKIVTDWLHEGGAMQVTASAGSGKTRILTESVRRLLPKAEKEYFRIICLTFTNRAAEEMAERLEGLKGLKDLTVIGTLHSFALQIVKENKHLLGYEKTPHILESEVDRKEILKKVFLETPILRKHFVSDEIESVNDFVNIERRQDYLLTYYITWINEQKQKLVYINAETQQFSDWKLERLILFKTYNEYLFNQNFIDFADILVLAWKILTEFGRGDLYGKLYKYVLVDEAQDLSFAQYELIRALCNGKIKNILMVGDARQAIHGYAGANSKYFLENFKTDYNAVCRPIFHNYRSSKAVINFANRLMPSAELREAQDQYFPGNSEIVFEFSDQEKEAMWIIDKIHELLKENSEEFEGKLNLSRIAVLGRTRFVFSKLVEALDVDSLLHDNYSIRKASESLLPQSRLLRIFELGSRIISNIEGMLYYTELANLLRISNHDLGLRGFDFIRQAIMGAPDEILSLEARTALIGGLLTIEKSPDRFIEALETLSEYSNQLSEDEQLSIFEDIELLRHEWLTYLRNTKGGKQTIADFRRFVAVEYTKQPSGNGLTLATVHTVKGLEFDVVFLMGMNEGTFPHFKATSTESIEEERNNAYVAVTRAKRHIYITYTLSKQTQYGSRRVVKKSRFLEGM